MVSAAACLVLPALQFWILTIGLAKRANWPWHERARLLWPARLSLGWNVLFLPAVLIFAPMILRPPETPPLIHPFVVWLILFISAIHSGRLCRNFGFTEKRPYLASMKAWLGEQLVKGSFYLVTILSFSFSESEWNTRSTIQAFVVLGALVGLAYGGALYILKILGLLTPAEPAVVEGVAEISARLRMPPPKVLIFHAVHATAFAFPWSHTIILSERLVRTLPPASVLAICRHEIAHLSESRLVTAARLFFIPYLLLIAMSRPIVGSVGVFVWVLLFAVFSATSRQLLKLWRKMEVRADAHSAETDLERRAYAQALEKLYEINLIPAVLSENQTHPDLYDRLRNCGVEPAFPRPHAPNTGPAGALFAFVCAAAITAILKWP